MIRTLLGQRRIRSQEQLLRILKEAGLLITQATLSRDLKSLHVGKHPDKEGGYVYILTDEPNGGDVEEILRGFRFLAFSGRLALVKTLPGYAGSVAFRLDSLQIEGILGTIAGDDTILVVPREGVSKAQLMTELCRRIPGIEEKLES